MAMNIPVSFEFFPPKTPEGADKLRLTRQALYAHQPEFCSVTFGAGGSTQEGTFNTVKAIQDEGVAAACHFSCVGATRATVREQLAALQAMGIRRLVALRGDLPSGYGIGGEFMKFTRRPNRPMLTCRPLPPRSRLVPIRPSRSIFSMPTPTFALSMTCSAWVSMCRWCPASCRSPVQPS